MAHTDTPAYNLKAVVKETGLKADTLRAWERRYGIPSPRRTTSGHRLYSQRDVEILHWLADRQAEGLNISRAVELWRRLEQEGESAEAGLLMPAPALQARATHEGDDTVSRLREEWVAACLRFDEQEAEAQLAHGFALFAPEIVCVEILQKGLATIGDRWLRGTATAQQEHFASALALRRLETLLAASPPPRRMGRILIGCPPGEEHTFAPLMLSLLLRRRAWDTLYLGANVPLASLEATVVSARPTLVILTAQQLTTAASLLEMGEALALQRIPLAFGGSVFSRLPDLHRAIPGHFLGARLESAVTTVETLMAQVRPKLAQQPASPEYRAALEHFNERRAHLEAGVWRRLESWPFEPRMLAAANSHFGQGIAAALTLGRMEYLTADMQWVQGLLLHHLGMPAERLESYTEAWLETAEEELDLRGGPVVAWLARTVGTGMVDESAPRLRRAAGR